MSVKLQLMKTKSRISDEDLLKIKKIIDEEIERRAISERI